MGVHIVGDVILLAFLIAWVALIVFLVRTFGRWFGRRR